jgi:DnaJ domain
MDINDLKSELILRILLVIPVIVLIGQTCLFFFKNIKNKEKEEVDFEELVRRKTEYYKFSGESLPETPRQVNLSNTEKVYNEFFALAQNEKSPEKKKFLQIFASMQWGESPFHFEILNYLEKTYLLKADLIQITKALKELIKNDILISPKWRNLPNLSDLEQIVALRVIFDIFLTESKIWGKENLKVFCKKEELDLIQFCKAITYYFCPANRTNFFSKIVTNNPSQINLINTYKAVELQNKINEKLIEQIEKGNSPRIFLQEIYNLSILFDSLKKIEPLQSKFDLVGARRIFDLKNGASLEEIKKRYKSLAKINHPDTLVSLELPEDIIKMVNGNFSQIKQAYDLLVAHELAR